MKIPYLFIIVLFCFSGIYAQSSKIQKADELASQKNYAAEVELRDEIIASMEDTFSDSYKTQLYKIKFAQSYLTSDMEKATSLIEEAISVFETMEGQNPREKLYLYLEYSYVLIPTNQPQKAWEAANTAYELALQNDSEETPYQKEIAASLKQLAHVKWYMQNYEGAITYFEQALENTIQAYGYYSMPTAEINHFLGVVYSFTPNFTQTLNYGLKAQEIYEKIQPENKFILFKQYASNFETLIKYGDLEKCADLIEKMTLYFNTHKNDKSFINGDENLPHLDAGKALYYYNKIQYAGALNDSVQVEENYRSFQKIIPEENIEYSPMERNIIVKYDLETGSFFHKAGNYEKAKKHYLNALHFSESISYSFGALQAYWVLTTLGMEYEKWDDVIIYAQKALSYPEINNFNRLTSIRHNLAFAYFGTNKYEEALEIFNEELNSYLNAPENLNDFIILQDLLEIGDILLEFYHLHTNENYLEKSYKAYREASVLFSRLYRRGKFNEQLANLQNKIYEGMLSCVNLLDNYHEESLTQVEKNNSDYLWSNFLRNHKRIYADSLNLNDKAYHQFSQNDFQLTNFQGEMDLDEIAVNYIITDSLVFAYKITRDQVQLQQLPITRSFLFDKTNEYLSSLKNIDSEYEEQARELYHILLEPIELGQHEKLTFINNSFLSYLPFETLINSQGEFLLKKYAIGYTSSLKLWLIQRKLRKESSTNLGLFSPEYKATLAVNFNDSLVNTLVRSGYYELKGAKAEAQKIQELFDGHLFLAEEASKTNFVENAADYEILHLAMHAVLDEKQPEKSTLIFNNNEKLYLSELYQMNIPANLAVLSACNTGTGSIQNGEGVQSLSRAFTYAGVKSTVRSLWPIPDRETAQIMPLFYQNLKVGQDKAGALRDAKLTYLHTTTDKALRHPYYWAGLVVSGDTSPISSGISWWWYALGTTLLLGIVLLFIRKGTRKS